jgi:hypothetical protein
MGAWRVNGMVWLLALGAAGCGERAMAQGGVAEPSRTAAELPHSASLELEAPATLVSDGEDQPPPPPATQARRPRMRVRPMTVIIKPSEPAEAKEAPETAAEAPQTEAEAAAPIDAEAAGLYASKIQAAILADPRLADDEIEVTIVDGMVLLTGKVGDRKESEAATTLAAKALEGVLPVSNRLMLRR